MNALPSSIAGTSDEWYCSASENSQRSCAVTSSLTVHSTVTSPASFAAVSFRWPDKSRYPLSLNKTTGSRFERTDRVLSRLAFWVFDCGRSGSGKI